METEFRDGDRLAAITVGDGAPAASPELDQERRVAIYDLLEENRFRPVGEERAGPFELTLDLEGRRLVCAVAAEGGAPIKRFELPLGSVRTAISDYLAVCDDYFEAIKRLSPGQIEAIDASRRELHDEGSEALREKLAAEAAIDPKTARRLFTLLCAVSPRD